MFVVVEYWEYKHELLLLRHVLLRVYIVDICSMAKGEHERMLTIDENCFWVEVTHLLIGWNFHFFWKYSFKFVFWEVSCSHVASVVAFHDWIEWVKRRITLSS